MKEKEEADENKCWMQFFCDTQTEHGTTLVLYWMIPGRNVNNPTDRYRSQRSVTHGKPWQNRSVLTIYW